MIFFGRYNENEILTGPEKVAKRIFGKISEKEKSVFIEYFFNGKKYGTFKKLFGSEVAVIVNGCEIKRLGVFSVLSFLIKAKPKVIHIISFERFALTAFLYKVFFRVKILYNVHGVMSYENEYVNKQSGYRNFKDKISEKIFLKYSDVIFLLSNNSKNYLDKFYKVKKERIFFIKNGIDKDFHIAGGQKLLNESDSLKLVFISNPFIKEKGFSLLKESLEMIEEKIELYIIDNKKNESNISFGNKNVKSFCVDKMPVKELAEFLVDKDVFISPGFYESFGLTSVECMAAGLVPVLTKETGASGLITDGKNGFILDYGDKEKLCSIINQLTQNPELRKRVSSEAIKIYDLLKWEIIAEHYMNIYKSIQM